MRPIFPRKEKNNVQRFKIISFKEIDEKNWSLKKAVLNLKVLTCPECLKTDKVRYGYLCRSEIRPFWYILST